MNEQGLRFRIGVFVLASALLLVVLITLFGSFPALFKRHKNYTIRFTDAAGVGPGTPVRRSGIRIGEVRSVELDDDTGEVIVHIMIDRRYSIRWNEQPTLVHGLLGGDTSIDFIPVQANGRGEEGAEAAEDNRVAQKDKGAPKGKGRGEVPEGTELRGVQQPNVARLLNQASDMMPAAQATLNQMQKSLQRIDQMTPQMEETMREYRELAKETRKALPEVRETNREIAQLTKELRKTNQEIQGMAADTRKLVPELRKTNDEAFVAIRNWGKVGEDLHVLIQGNREKILAALDNLNTALSRIANTFNDENQKNLAVTLKNFRAASDQLDGLLKSTDALLKESQKTMKQLGDTAAKTDVAIENLNKATKPLAERSEGITRNLDESADKLNKALTDVRALLRVIGQQDGTFQRLISDPALYNNLNATLCNVNRLVPQVERILKDVEVFSDKLARHPEKIGLGGVVRPSSGLKEPPSAPVAPPPAHGPILWPANRQPGH
ncbi:MAG TPA: MlaD family protein [Gemmataceae bacterium]|nr:MlaD family protein [Gemmataceae bacterium]